MILIALGSNLPSHYGLPYETVRAAVDILSVRGLSIVSSSRLWMSEPVPKSDQPLYCNAVVCVETDLSAESLLKLLQEIESDFGRVRHTRNEARTLDLDILNYQDQIFDTHDLSLPHPRLHQRAFVLYPLLEVAQDWVHPVLKKNVTEMVQHLGDDQEIFPLEKTAA